MATASASSTDYQVDTIVRLAMLRCGALNAAEQPDAQQLDMGRQFLWLGLAALANDGIMLRAVERVTQDLASVTADTPYFDAPSDTVSIEKGATVTTGDGVDIPVNLIDRHAYMALPMKTTEGRPTDIFPERMPSGAWRIYVYQVPSDDWESLSYSRLRGLRDVSAGNVTLDLDTKWHLAIVYFLSAEIAGHLGKLEREASLRDLYVAELGRARGDEVSRGDTRFTFYADPWC